MRASNLTFVAIYDIFRTHTVIAHVIRNQKTKMFRVISELTARHRWCLSGTPIQNHIEDLASLAGFLRVPHLTQRADFQKYIISPLTSGQPEPTRNLHLFLKSTCLRRTQSLLGIPEATYMIQSLKLSSAEQSLYDSILESVDLAIDDAISNSPTLGGQSLVMEAWGYLRRICVQGTYVSTLIAALRRKPPRETIMILQEREDGEEGKSLLFSSQQRLPAYLRSSSH